MRARNLAWCRTMKENPQYQTFTWYERQSQVFYPFFAKNFLANAKKQQKKRL